MKSFNRMMALLLALVLVVACVPAGAVTAFAAEVGETEPTAVPTNAEVPAEPSESAEVPSDADSEDELWTGEADMEGTNPFLDLSKELDPAALELLWELFPDGVIPDEFNITEILEMFNLMGGSSGSEIGDGGGGGNPAGSGSSNMVAAGVTMQVVYYRYDQCFNRYNSHGSVVSTLQSGKALPWNSTGKDNGTTAATVFDTYTISPHTFMVKAKWPSYPYVYHFPNDGLHSDNCVFDWLGFTNYWFNYYNPGGQPSTSPYIVRNEAGGSYEIEQFLAKIILGNSYGAWDKLDVAKGQTVATDSSLFAKVLKYLGASDLAIQNYLDAYFGNLSITQDGDRLIPTIIWSWVGAENLGGTNRIYTIGDVDDNGSPTPNWLKTAYTSPSAAISGYGSCSWMKSSSDTMICKLMIGATHGGSGLHNTVIWANDAPYLFGTGFVNRIQTQVDATAENGTNTFYYLRGYWTPYGTGNGSISLTKTNPSGSEKLAGAEFTLYRDAECKIPVTSADYETLSSSDTGYVSASVRRTNSNGQAAWTGLYTGLYFLMETKAPEGYQVNVDSSGHVEVRSVAVSGGSTSVTLTNAENSKPVSLKKTINASQACIDQIKNNPFYSLAGAEYSVTLNGKVVETLKTDANGNAASTKTYKIGDVLTIKETKAPVGFQLDTKSYTLTVSSGSNVINVSDIPVFDPPFALTKVDKDTTVPQGDGSFSGAVFKWEFFANNNWSGTAVRTWYFATDSNGRVTYSKDMLASGYTSDALYVSPAGVNQLPLGTLKITEVKNSLGYTVITKPLYCSIVYENGNAKHVWTADSQKILSQMANGDWGVEEPIDTKLFGSLTIEKYDAVTGKTPQGEGSFAGAKFRVVNSSKNAVVVNGKTIAPGNEICVLTTDTNGIAKSGSIFPVGTYTVTEIAAPPGYTVNTAWKQTFSVTASAKDHSLTFDNGKGCPDTPVNGRIQITKKIANTVDGTTAPEKGAKFDVIDKNGKTVDTIVTGDNGIGTSKNLPYGTYTVKQTAGAAGTVFVDSFTVTISENGKTYQYSKDNPLWTASVSIHKEEAGAKTPLVAVFELCERSADGTVKVLETGTTNKDGNLTFNRRIVYTDGVCNKTTYFIREKEAPAGYELDTKEYPVSCTARDQKISVTVVNVPVIGSIELRKQSSVGEPMKGVRFMLEYSLDGGKTWSAVVKRGENDNVTPGTCTSAALDHEGCLVTDKNGIARFDGLRVYTADGKAISYRVTELQTLNGSSLMPDSIWEGELSTQKEGKVSHEIILGVVNSPVLELPETGSPALRILSIAAAVSALAGVLLIIRRKKEM